MKFTSQIKIIKNTQVLKAIFNVCCPQDKRVPKITSQIHAFPKSKFDGNPSGFLTVLETRVPMQAQIFTTRSENSCFCKSLSDPFNTICVISRVGSSLLSRHAFFPQRERGNHILSPRSSRRGLHRGS